MFFVPLNCSPFIKPRLYLQTNFLDFKVIFNVQNTTKPWLVDDSKWISLDCQETLLKKRTTCCPSLTNWKENSKRVEGLTSNWKISILTQRQLQAMTVSSQPAAKSWRSYFRKLDLWEERIPELQMKGEMLWSEKPVILTTSY